MSQPKSIKSDISTGLAMIMLILRIPLVQREMEEENKPLKGLLVKVERELIYHI